MRLRIAIAFLTVLLLTVTGCGAKNELPDDPVMFSHSVENGYSVLKADDSEYIPFCDVDKDYIGECIGYCDVPVKDAEPIRHYIYSMTGQSAEEWIIEIDPDKDGSGLLYKETSVDNVPDGLQQEYNLDEEY